MRGDKALPFTTVPFWLKRYSVAGLVYSLWSPSPLVLSTGALFEAQVFSGDPESLGKVG